MGVDTPSVVGVPDDVEDGEYLLSVREVVLGRTARGSDTVAATLRPVGGGAVTEALLSSEPLPEATAGLVCRVRVADGEVAEAMVDVDGTVRRNAASVSASEYAVPLREVHGGDASDSRVLSMTKNHSLLALGEPGSGKTEFIKLLLPQIEAEPDEPVVVFDFKGEYDEWAEQRGDIVRLSTRESTHHWNPFEEIQREAELEEIGRSLFAEAEQEADQPFFPRAARQVFVAVMKIVHREQDDPHPPYLINSLEQNDRDDLHAILNSYGEFSGVADNISPGAPRQSMGVLGHLQTVVNETFVGDFTETGSFSIREYMQNPQGRTLVLDYPIREGNRVTAMFTFLLNWAIRHALADPDRNAYFVLDEFAQIPHVEQIETLVATGRSRNTQAILGLQSVSQLEEKYGADTARSIMSGLTQEVFLRTGDPRSVEYVTNRLGGERHVSVQRDPGRSVERPVFGEMIQGFAPGEGVFVTDGRQTHARVPMWEDLDPDTRRAIRTRERTTRQASLDGYPSEASDRARAQSQD